MRLFTITSATTLVVMLTQSTVAPGQTAATKVGDRVPDFAVRTLEGKNLKLSDLQKQAKTGIVVLSFWCSTCHSCRHVEEQLAKLAKDHAGQVAVLALDANADDTPDGVKAFAKKKGLTVPIVLDPAGQTADVFGVTKTTTTLVIDASGTLRYCGQFETRTTSAQDALNAVLAGKEVAVKTTPQVG